MEKLIIEEVRVTNPAKEVADEIVTDSSTQFLSKEEVTKTIVTTNHGFVGDVKQAYNGKKFEDIAIYVYPAHHYSFWQEDLQTELVPKGIMGENLIVQHLDEFSVFIGDIYKCGDALLQVSQPHLSHWGVSVRMKVDDFAVKMENTGRVGWYFRVLEVGEIKSGDELVLIDRPYPEWSVAVSHEIMHFHQGNLSSTYDLLDNKLLGSYWREILEKRLRGQDVLENDRLIMPMRE